MPKNLDNINYWYNWIDSTPDIIFIKDLQGVYVGVSKSTAILAGFECADDMIGKNDYEIYPSDKAEAFVSEDKEVLESLKPKLIQDSMLHPKRGLIFIETLKSPLFNEKGVLIGLQGISRDVTEKCNYEQTICNQQSQMSTIVDNIPFPIWIKDVEGRYLLINKSYEKFYSVEREKVIGQNPLEVLRDSKAFSQEELERLHEEDRKIFEEKIIAYTTNRMVVDDREFFLEITKAPILNDKGELIGIAGISIDVTEHKHYEEKLMKSRDLAELSNKAKSDFLANMSHEIRTPMNGILGFIQLLSETALDEEQKDYVFEAKKSSEILLKLLNDVLDLSKIEAGKMTMENISFNIRYVVEDVATLASSNAVQKNLEINALCHSNIPEKVFGDPSRLKQVLNNFVNNAIKFTDQGEIVITAKLIEKFDNKVKLLFSVEDTGIGISKENQDKIFEAFTQADSSTTRKYGGTGLGLTISKNIIHMLNGEVMIESKPNSGSKFSFSAEFEIDDSPEEYKTDYQNLKGLKILIVDDNKTNLKVLNHYLKEFYITSLKAMNAQEALCVLKDEKNSIDLVLTDFCMPEVSGIELASEIREIEKYKDVPIVLLTSRAQRGDYKVAQENNFRGYLPKPVRKNDLIECISMLVSSEDKTQSSAKNLITQHTIKEKHKSEDVKILLVEDNPLNQKLIIKMMSKAGYSCDLAQNGQEAVDSIKSNSYDMIFMDCQMPVMDGYEATFQIKKYENENGKKLTPIIALTANAMHSDIKVCENAGMDDYMAKPVNFELLIEKIKKYSPEKSKKSRKINESNVSIVSKSDIISAAVKDLAIDEEDAKMLLEEFLNDAMIMAKSLDENYERSNFEQIAEIAHSIKGASGNLRVKNLFEVSASLESFAKKNNAVETALLINKIKNILSELIK